MRAEMLPWFARKRGFEQPDCSRYGYDCDAPWNYYGEWSGTGGTIIYADGHAKFVTSSGEFDQTMVHPAGNRSGDAHDTAGTWYWACD